MAITSIEAEIVKIANTVVELKKVYDYPVFTLGREMPALEIRYDGFTQKPSADSHTDVYYSWELTLFLSLEGRSVQDRWDDLKSVTEELLQAFRQDYSLGGTVWLSMIEGGSPIIEAPSDPRNKPKYVGHTFRLVTRKEQSPY